jgi:hypothetical protein
LNVIGREFSGEQGGSDKHSIATGLLEQQSVVDSAYTASGYQFHGWHRSSDSFDLIEIGTRAGSYSCEVENDHDARAGVSGLTNKIFWPMPAQMGRWSDRAPVPQVETEDGTIAPDFATDRLQRAKGRQRFQADDDTRCAIGDGCACLLCGSDASIQPKSGSQPSDRIN